MADQAAQYLARFRSATPEQRRDAIIKLGKSGDLRAIPLLQQIASMEPDPNLHDLIQKAIQHLQAPSVRSPAQPIVQSPERPVTPAFTPEPVSSPSYTTSYSSYDTSLSNSPPSSYALSTEAAPTAIAPVKPVSERQRQLAKSRLDYALSLHVSKQSDKALSVLAEAARADPSILETQMGRNLAMALTDEPFERAIEIIHAKSRDPKVVGQAGRPVFKLSASAELCDTAIELLGLLVVLVLLIALAALSITRIFDRAFGSQGNSLGTNMTAIVATDIARVQQSNASPSAQATQIAALQELQQEQATLNQTIQATTSSLPALFSFALNLALRGLLSTVLGIIAAYIVGTVLGGSGSILRFFRYLMRAYIAVYLAVLISFGLLYFLNTNPNLAANVQAALGGLALLLFGADALIGFLVIDYAAARGHQFGFFRGFASVLIGNIVLSILLGLLGVGSALGGL
ncbi:MAG: hypothetical protein ACYDBJ_11275 [Aggregatilineales bacterium]